MKQIQTSSLRILAVWGCIAFAGLLRAAEPGFVAAWSDDSRTADVEVRQWHRLQSIPTLGQRPLFDDKNPIRWLRDTRQPEPVPPRAFVDFIGGDCLPGRVVAYVESSAGDGPLPQLLVAPAIDIDLPGQHRDQIDIRLDFVRRIVWQPHDGGKVEPGCLVLVDGRRVAFRSIRWSDAGVQVLADEGPAHFEFAEMAEICLPAANAWDAHNRTLALLSPDLSSRLMRLDGAGGSRITTSLARLQAHSVKGDEPQKWFHLVQPAWSSEALCIGHRQIRLRTFVSPQEVPLSWVQPQASLHRGVFSSGWRELQIDRNVQGGPLRVAGQTFGWGLGAHAHHEFEFDLPASAQSFRTRIGLDQVVAGGGCARGRISIGGKPAFASPLLVGSAQIADSGVLPIGTTGSRRLTLVADAAVQERPSGADPLDVRDVVDWLEPIVQLDPIALRREVEQAAPRALWGANGWTVDALSTGSWYVASRFSDADHAHPRFRPLLHLDAPLMLARRIRVEPGQTSAVVKLGRPPRSSNRATFEIAINGRRMARQEIPALGESDQFKPIVLSLAAYADQGIELAIRIDPVGKQALVDWRGIVLTDDVVEVDRQPR